MRPEEEHDPSVTVRVRWGKCSDEDLLRLQPLETMLARVAGVLFDEIEKAQPEGEGDAA